MAPKRAEQTQPTPAMQVPLSERGGRRQMSISCSAQKVAYALQEPLREELDRPQKFQIIVQIDIDETSE